MKFLAKLLWISIIYPPPYYNNFISVITCNPAWTQKQRRVHSRAEAAQPLQPITIHSTHHHFQGSGVYSLQCSVGWNGVRRSEPVSARKCSNFLESISRRNKKDIICLDFRIESYLVSCLVILIKQQCVKPSKCISLNARTTREYGLVSHFCYSS